LMHFAGINELINQGWPISEERLAEFFGEKQFDDPSKLRQTLLDSDIREYGVTVLMDRVDYRIGELKGPVVVQISKLLNVSCSKLSQSSRSGSDGLYKIQLTDGHSTINAVQFDPIPTLTKEFVKLVVVIMLVVDGMGVLI
uniref:RE01471p (inferred by orthology to a D. melanogaster protein) n=1 Tax=Anisakis simplex TaxID=6269 RepID=A0A0M3J780_ANISI